MAKSNQVGFRLNEPYLSLFQEEARIKKVSIHDIAKQYAIAGYEASTSSKHDETALKNIIFTVCLIQEQIAKSNPDSSSDIIKSAQQKAVGILEKMKEGDGV